MENTRAPRSKKIWILTGGSRLVVTSSRPTDDRPLASADVTASEIACYSYCAKAWHLEHVLRLKPSRETAERRDAGISDHALHGRRVRLLSRVARRRRILVATLLLLALLAAAGALLM